MVQVSFDFWQSCPRGGDPDARCHLLRHQHRLLWGRPLPSGREFWLEDRFPDGYLWLTSGEVSMNLSSDSVVPTYGSYRRAAAVSARAGIGDQRLRAFEALAGGIGATMLFPGNQVSGQPTINQARGTRAAIGDRMDLTLECIRRHYLTRAGDASGATSPLAATLLRYEPFFAVFGDFETYVEHFLLQDLVSGGHVVTFLPLQDFARAGLPRDPAEYNEYLEATSAFVRSRTERMRELVPEPAAPSTSGSDSGDCSAASCAHLAPTTSRSPNP